MGGKGSGKPKKPPKIGDFLKTVLPVDDIFADDEKEIYLDIVNLYMEDFDVDDLSSGDMDDILSLSTNKILEIRLLKTSKSNVNKHLDVSNALEKLRKQNSSFKDNLLSRRKDRVNPNELKGFSIVDLAAAFDNEKKAALEKKARKLKKEEEAMLEKRDDYVGNRYDVDVDKKDNED
jgi:hypothetical protein